MSSCFEKYGERLRESIEFGYSLDRTFRTHELAELRKAKIICSIWVRNIKTTRITPTARRVLLGLAPVRFADKQPWEIKTK